MYTRADIEKLAEDFAGCQRVLTALGDENRQHLILEMMKMENSFGARVGDIRERPPLLIYVLQRAKAFTAELPDRSGER